METVNDDLRVGQESPGGIPETAVHVHDHIFHFIPVGESQQVVLDRPNRSVREDVKNAMAQGICDDALKPLPVNITLEFVEGDGLGEALGLHNRHHPEYPLNAADGGPRIPGNVLHAAAPAQQVHDLFSGSMREAHVPTNEIIRF